MIQLIIFLPIRDKSEVHFCKAKAQRQAAKDQNHTARHDQRPTRKLRLSRPPRLSRGLSHERIKWAKGSCWEVVKDREGGGN